MELTVSFQLQRYTPSAVAIGGGSVATGEGECVPVVNVAGGGAPPLELGSKGWR